MDIKTISLVVIVFSLFLLTTIYLNPSSTHGHSHGPVMQETEKADEANSTTHETIK
jgi:hypothetical protein